MSILATIKSAWGRIPTGVKNVVRDAIEGGLSAIVALNLAIPGSLVDAKAEALTAVVAAAGAIIAVLRREALPIIVQWFENQFSTPAPTPPAPPAA